MEKDILKEIEDNKERFIKAREDSKKGLVGLIFFFILTCIFLYVFFTTTNWIFAVVAGLMFLFLLSSLDMYIKEAGKKKEAIFEYRMLKKIQKYIVN